MGCVQRKKQIQINNVVFKLAQQSFNKSYSANNSKAVYNLPDSFNQDVKQSNIHIFNQIEDDNKFSTIQDLNSKVNYIYSIIKELNELSSSTNKCFLVKHTKTKMKPVTNVINRNFLTFLSNIFLFFNLYHIIILHNTMSIISIANIIL